MVSDHILDLYELCMLEKRSCENMSSSLCLETGRGSLLETCFIKVSA
jgi:hypothetical protein